MGMQGERAWRVLFQLLYQLSYPPNGGAGLEPATHWLRSIPRLRHLQEDIGRARSGWSLHSAKAERLDSNQLTIRLARSISCLRHLPKMNERATGVKPPVVLSYSR